MKLLISSVLFYPSRLGGPANTLYWLAKALVKAEVAVSVVATDKHIKEGIVIPDTWSDVFGIRVRYCKSGKLCFLKELWYIWKEMRTSNTVMLCDMFQRQVLPVAFMAKLPRPICWRRSRISQGETAWRATSALSSTTLRWLQKRLQPIAACKI